MISSSRAAHTHVDRQLRRCAIYTRKSVQEDTGQDFNSLQAQRESAEAFIASQKHEGWECISTQYDDHGFTGANLDRPALRRLIADIEVGLIDCVVVYKVDRLSRSLLDFAKLIELLDRHHVNFVSVTQQFNTSTSMGRLMLHILLSFAQFERETISERTRDKMGAARRKGMWVGGAPPLGYDVRDKRLAINEAEAVLVRTIFSLYLELGGLIPVVQELGRRGWNNKSRTTKDGRKIGGKPFTKGSLHRLLLNPTYCGLTIYKDVIYQGQHAGVVDRRIWDETQALLARNGQAGGVQARNKFGALLKGILRCANCSCSMSPTHSTKGANKRYRYYRCQTAQQSGHAHCPAPSVPAHEIEQLVINQIKRIGADPMLVSAVIADVADQELDERAAIRALAAFDPVWEALSPKEKVDLIQLLIERVDYDGVAGKLAITFHPTGLQSLFTMQTDQSK